MKKETHLLQAEKSLNKFVEKSEKKGVLFVQRKTTNEC